MDTRNLLLAHARSAETELRHKTCRQIHADTSYAWAGRALAAAKLGRHDEAVDFWHEAVEHAALAGTEVLAELRAGVQSLGVTLDRGFADPWSHSK